MKTKIILSLITIITYAAHLYCDLCDKPIGFIVTLILLPPVCMCWVFIEDVEKLLFKTN